VRETQGHLLLAPAQEINEKEKPVVFANATSLHRTISHGDQRGNRANAQLVVLLVAFAVRVAAKGKPPGAPLDNIWVRFFV
jgi:hypothetical protein